MLIKKYPFQISALLSWLLFFVMIFTDNDHSSAGRWISWELINLSVLLAITGTLPAWKKRGHLLPGTTILLVKMMAVYWLNHSWWTFAPAATTDASLNFVWTYPPFLITLSMLEAIIINKYFTAPEK